jgi:hypothetical protein
LVKNIDEKSQQTIYNNNIVIVFAVGNNILRVNSIRRRRQYYRSVKSYRRPHRHHRNRKQLIAKDRPKTRLVRMYTVDTFFVRTATKKTDDKKVTFSKPTRTIRVAASYRVDTSGAPLAARSTSNRDTEWALNRKIERASEDPARTHLDSPSTQMPARRRWPIEEFSTDACTPTANRRSVDAHSVRTSAY